MIIQLFLIHFVIPFIGMICLHILMAKDYNTYYTDEKLPSSSKKRNNTKK